MFDIDFLLSDGEEHSPSGCAAPVRHLALIGNALPRQCGLATFTSHVADALRQRYPTMRLDHYAMDDKSGVEYPDEIRIIEAESAASYREAAERIQQSGAEAVWLQHEYGIFGGDAGSHILELVSHLDLPLIVTLHTVLDRPKDAEEVVLRRLMARADRVIVMAAKGSEILRMHYGVPPSRIQFVPHGVPDRPFRDSAELKQRFEWQGRRVLMTFGLLAPDKGIRHMIEAMPAIVEAQPDALYAVVGATHPNIVRHEGEAHRDELKARAIELGVADHVEFIDSFVEQEELLDMLQASDVYITPYLNMAQMTSGTLSYAVAVGKPVIATPYIHAREILADDHGIIVRAGDASALAEAAIPLLRDDHRRDAISRAAYKRGRTMVWPSVVEQSLSSLTDRNRSEEARPVDIKGAALSLDALERMSDAVGILQHAIHSVPDRDHGYCIDDNARALMLMALRDNDDRAMQLATRYAAFVQHGWNPDEQRFRNFMGYDRRWLEDTGSDDSNGRTVWALGVTASHSPDRALRDWARSALENCAPHLTGGSSPRAAAFAALGGRALLRSRPGHPLALSLIRNSAEQLMQLHDIASRDDWNWFEPELAYDNARLPEALIQAGVVLADRSMIDRGLSTLRWLVDMQTGPRGMFRPVGSYGFGRPYSAPLAFDQQPVETWATIDAAAAAFEATGDEEWPRHARQAFGWFFGDNDAGIPLADASDGSCYDGLMATGINRNQGAESILSLHLAALTMRRAFGSAKRAGQEGGSAPEAANPAASSKAHDSISTSPAPA